MKEYLSLPILASRNYLLSLAHIPLPSSLKPTSGQSLLPLPSLWLSLLLLPSFTLEDPCNYLEPISIVQDNLLF